MDRDFSEALERLKAQGACLWPGVIPSRQMDALEVELAVGPPRRPVPLEYIGIWLKGTELPGWAAGVLGPAARPVRALLMGKTAEDNWAIAFHQDTTVAVKAHREVPGFGPWVNKANFYHAQAPAEVMARMLSVRLHLDDSGEANGPLQWIGGSHEFGKLGAAMIATLAAAGPINTLHVRRGEMLFMNPLVLHGSGRALASTPRRVLHIEWAGLPLPGGLEWAWF